MRTMFSAKIHRATVTHADLHYVGSVTVDADLLDAADLLPGEKVAIVDVTNGARLETYIIEGQRGSGVIGINGAAAHLINVGDHRHPDRLPDAVGPRRPKVASPGGPRRRRQPHPAAGYRPGRSGPRGAGIPAVRRRPVSSPV